MSIGWIKLHRRLQDSGMYKNLNSRQRDVLIQILLLANHETKEWEWGKEIYKCDPGQFITSLEKLKSKCAKDVTLKNIRTSLYKLEKWGFLTNKSANTGRLITVVNWELYQDKDKKVADISANKGQTGGKQVATNKNDKNVKNIKNNNIYRKKFQKPSLEVLREYFKERESDPKEAEAFLDHYESNGWRVGKNPMKDWKAAVRNWLRNKKTWEKGKDNGGRGQNKNLISFNEWLNEGIKMGKVFMDDYRFNKDYQQSLREKYNKGESWKNNEQTYMEKR